MRRNLSHAVITLLVLVGCVADGTRRAAAADPARPNVVLIVTDDLGYADIAARPQSPEDVRAMGTPALDRLAAMGTLFTDAYSTAPICSPARVGLITGRYQQRWGNYWYGEGGLPADQTTLPQALKQLGYATKKIGKTHLNGGPVEHPLDHGYDEYLGFNHHTWDYIRLSQRDLDAYLQRVGGNKKRLGFLCVGPLQRDRGWQSYDDPDAFTTEIFTDEAVEFIERDRGDQPYFVHLSYNAVHMPTYITDYDYARKLGFEQPAWNRDAATWDFPYWDPNQGPWGKWHKNWGHLEKVDPLGRKRYLSHLLAMDDGIGRVLDAIERSGQRENTIVVFLSDNGGTINTYSDNTPLSGWKYMFGEGGVRVPMIVAAPGRLKGGQTLGGLASAMDVFPTVLELAGGRPADNLDGRSLVGKINAGSHDDAHAMLCWSDGRGAKVIRKGPWKLAMGCEWEHSAFVINAQGLAERAAQPYAYPGGTVLFNLAEDIGETTDLAGRRPDLVAELTADYQAWRSSMSDPRNSKGELKKKKKCQ